MKNEFDFMGIRRIAGSISVVLVLVSIVSLAVNSLEFGLDFTSGTSVRLNYSEAIVLNEVNAIHIIIFRGTQPPSLLG